MAIKKVVTNYCKSHQENYCINKILIKNGGKYTYAFF